MSKNIFLNVIAILASVFSIRILMNNPEPIGFFIVFLLITFIALIIYIQFLNINASKLSKKSLLKNKHIKNHH